jgi:hypothetical protein
MPQDQTATRKRKRPIGLFVATASVGLLVAVVLILLLFGGGHRVSRKMPVQSLATELRLACANFHLEYGRYPWALREEITGSTTIDCRQVCTELRGLPGASINKAKRDYVGALQSKFVKDDLVVDTWGRPLEFRVDPKTGEPVIWSYGRNGKDETNDGESPDPKKKPKTYYWFGKGDFGDDIVSN